MLRSQATILLSKLLLLAWLGFSEAKEHESGLFRSEDHTYWLVNHTINLVNYVAEVGTHALIMSPITPAPVGIRWFSLIFNSELSFRNITEVQVAASSHLEEFQKNHNVSWHNVYKYDAFNRWLRILNVRHDYADVFRVSAGDSQTASTGQTGHEAFDVEITLMTFEQHQCNVESKPQDPRKGDVLVLNCSVIINGLWNTSLVFRNDFDGSEVRGQVSMCDRQPRVGRRICSAVSLKTTTTVFVYSCLLEFPLDGRRDPLNPTFKDSKWTAEFSKKVVCNLPKNYLQSIPSDITFLCNRKSCESTVYVYDTVTCVASGYPQPIIDLRIHRISAGHENRSHDRGIELNSSDTRNARDVASEDEAQMSVDYKKETIDEMKVYESYRMSRNDIGKVEVTCNASNVLGVGYKVLVLDVRQRNETDDTHIDVEARAAGGEFRPFGGMSILCNGRQCKNMELLRIGDTIACHYDERTTGGKVVFILKVDNYEKNVMSPCVYTLRMEDVGKKFVQCIGYIDSSISVLEVYVIVLCAFRFPYGDPHHTEDYDDVAKSAEDYSHLGLVILCNDAPCDRPGRIIHTGNYVTCRYTDQRVSSITITVNGVVKVGRAVETDTEGYHKLSHDDHDKELHVNCTDTLNSAVSAAVNITPKLWPCPTDDDDKYAKEDAGRRGGGGGRILVVTHGPAETEQKVRDMSSCGQENFVLSEFILILIGMFAYRVLYRS